jgi:hypothetical protein
MTVAVVLASSGVLHCSLHLWCNIQTFRLKRAIIADERCRFGRICSSHQRFTWHLCCVTDCEWRIRMPEKATLKRARRDKRAGKAPTTQAGEFVREEMHHVREGKHGARSTKQAIAIGLSKARRSGVKPRRPPASAKAKTRQSAAHASRAAGRGSSGKSARRSKAISTALKREGRGAASRKALARQAKSAARRRSTSSRRASARRAVRTRGPQMRRAAARRAAQTRQRRKTQTHRKTMRRRRGYVDVG